MRCGIPPEKELAEVTSDDRRCPNVPDGPSSRRLDLTTEFDLDDAGDEAAVTAYVPFEADADVNAAIEIRRRGLIALGPRPRPEQPGLPVEPSALSRAPCKTREKEKSGTQPRGSNAPETVRA